MNGKTSDVGAEASLREWDSRYRRLVEHSPDIVYVFSDKRGGIYYSPRTADLLGYSLDYLYVHPFHWNESIHPDDRAAVRDAIRRFGEGHPFAMEYRIRNAAGAWLWVYDRSISRIESDDEVVIEGLATDITERRKIEAALRQAQKLEALGTLAGGIAHDFNNVITAVLGNAELARDKMRKGDLSEALSCLDEIEHAGRFARTLVAQIQAFSRRQPPVLVAQPLGPIVEEAMRMVRATVPTGVSLRVSLPAGPLAARVDAPQIVQVLMNLCTNAIQAMEGRAGHVEVGLDEAGAPEARAGRYVRLRVADDGAGMDDATRERAFEPFFTTKGMGEGSGLGLAVVHGVVQAHGGVVQVDSAPGKGTRVDVFLPRADA